MFLLVAIDHQFEISKLISWMPQKYTRKSPGLWLTSLNFLYTFIAERKTLTKTLEGLVTIATTHVGYETKIQQDKTCLSYL